MQLEKINKRIERRLENLDEMFDEQIRSMCEAKAAVEVVSFLNFLKEKEEQENG